MVLAGEKIVKSQRALSGLFHHGHIDISVAGGAVKIGSINGISRSLQLSVNKRHRGENTESDRYPEDNYSLPARNGPDNFRQLHVSVRS